MSYFDDIGSPGAANFTVGLDGGSRLAEMNKGVTPMFSILPVKNDSKSKDAGRPIFDEIEICTLFVAGDQYNRVTHPADSEYIQNRFPEEYRRWKEKHQDRHISGTPLREWPLIGPAHIAEFEALGIFNVEGLAGIPESSIGKFGLREWRAKAAAWLASAKDGAVVTKLAAENDAMRGEVKELADKVALLSDQLAAARAPKPDPGKHKAA
jgi:hypothetical protein